MPAPTHFLYLHGFRSSPQSTKARLVADWVAARHPAVRFWCPLLNPSPRLAMAAVMAELAHWPLASTVVAGSSLGGFYATWIGAQTGCRIGLINPAVVPARDLLSQVGTHPFWHSPEQSFEFERAYIDELQAQTLPIGQPPGERVSALIAKGDEVLDWREMTARYPGAAITLLEGSDHAISDFADHIDAFCAGLGF